MKSARYGTLFYGCRQSSASHASACWELAAAVVADLNSGNSRFVLLGMGQPGNLAGAEAALAWQTGYATNVDFRLGYPSPLDEYESLDELLDDRESDVAMLIGGPKPATLSEQARKRLSAIRTIAIGPESTRWSDPTPTVAIATAAPGIDAGGTVTRCDGVVLPLRPPLPPVHPDDRASLRALARQLGAAAVATRMDRRDVRCMTS